MGSSKEPHVVLVPYPAQGHINPFMQLARLLHSKGFHVTFVNNEFNHRRLIRSKGVEFVERLQGFRFEAVPDGLPPSDRDATQDIPTLSYSIHHNVLKKPFIELLQRLSSTHDMPAVTCVISDAIMNFAKEAADEEGIPSVAFWTASACGFMGHLQYFELVRRGFLPFKGTCNPNPNPNNQECCFSDESFLTDGTLDKPIDWVPGMPNMRLRDLPSFMRITNLDDIMFNYLGTQSQKTLKSSAILFNTFHDFEKDVLEAIKKLQPNIYTAGPLIQLLRHVPGSGIGSLNPSLWKEDTYCLEWLDKQAPESVVYVNYGSITVMSDQHLKEFAWGLANSKHPFLWIVRPDVVMGESGVLPKDFLDDVTDRGLIVSWCPQAEVLNHPSVGAYLSHCGWNSVSESVVGGVPLLCWPFFAEQQTNCRYACTVWGTGMEVGHDVKREELAELVREMMEGEKGEELRMNAKEWRRKAEVATRVGGSAYNDFERFVKEALHYD